MKKATPILSVFILLSAMATACFAQKARTLSHRATARNKKESEMSHLTHAEMIQFIRTVQTEAAGWKDTIDSIEPAALNISGQGEGVIEKEKNSLLFNLRGISKLQPGIPGGNMAVDLALEFQTFDELAEIKDGLSQLSCTLANYPNGQISAAQLLQIYREAVKAKSTLYGEIMARMVNLAISEGEKGHQ